MLKKTLFILIAFLVIISNIRLKAQILADCIGTRTKNTMSIEIKITNNTKNGIYIPFSDWVVSQSIKNSNYLIKYPPPNNMILISMCFIPSKFDEIAEERTVSDFDLYDFKLEYLPKIVFIEAYDSLKFKIRFNITNQGYSIQKENNKVLISIPYMNNDFEFIFRNNPDICNYIVHDKEISLDITKNLMNNVIRGDWKNYTKFKITDCEKKMMTMIIKDKIINCKCIIK